MSSAIDKYIQFSLTTKINMENSVLLTKAGTEKIKKKSAKERQVEAAIKNELNVVHLKEQQLNNVSG